MSDSPAPESAAALWARRNMTWLILIGAIIVIVLPRVSPYQPLNEYLNVFQRFSEWTLRKLEHLFRDYGYYVVFLGVLAENSMFLGLLIPGSIILILAGLSAENGSIDITLVLALAVAGALIGDTLSYLTGRLGWTALIEKSGAGKMIDRMREPMHRNRTWIVLGYHFAGYSRAVGPLASGLFKIPYRKWAPLDYTGATVWVVAYVMIGVVLGLFGVEFGDTKKMARLIEVLFTALLIITIVIPLVRSGLSSSVDANDEAGGDGEPAPAVGVATRDE